MQYLINPNTFKLQHALRPPALQSDARVQVSGSTVTRSCSHRRACGWACSRSTNQTPPWVTASASKRCLQWLRDVRLSQAPFIRKHVHLERSHSWLGLPSETVPSLGKTRLPNSFRAEGPHPSTARHGTAFCYVDFLLLGMCIQTCLGPDMRC